MTIRIVAAGGLALVALACASGEASRATEPVPFEIRGVVVDAGTRAAIPAALVRLDEVDAGGTTDAAGAFRVRGHAPPGRYLMYAARIGYAPARRRIRIRREGAIDVGFLAMRAEVMQLDDLIVPECMRHERPPAHTAPGVTVRAERDSAGAFWMVCRPTEQ